MVATHSTAQKNQLIHALTKPNQRKKEYMSEENNKNICRSFADGHHMHYIAVNSASRPRVPAQVRVYGGVAFQVTVEGETSLWFTHDPQRLVIALAGAKPENIEATKGRTWLFVKGDHSVECFNMTTRNVSPCVRELKKVDVAGLLREANKTD